MLVAYCNVGTARKGTVECKYSTFSHESKWKNESRINFCSSARVCAFPLTPVITCGKSTKRDFSIANINLFKLIFQKKRKKNNSQCEKKKKGGKNSLNLKIISYHRF